MSKATKPAITILLPLHISIGLYPTEQIFFQTAKLFWKQEQFVTICLIFMMLQYLSSQNLLGWMLKLFTLFIVISINNNVRSFNAVSCDIQILFDIMVVIWHDRHSFCPYSAIIVIVQGNRDRYWLSLANRVCFISLMFLDGGVYEVVTAMLHLPAIVLHEAQCLRLDLER